MGGGRLHGNERLLGRIRYVGLHYIANIIYAQLMVKSKLGLDHRDDSWRGIQTYLSTVISPHLS